MRNKRWLLFLTFFCHLTPDCHLQQLENPRDHDHTHHDHQHSTGPGGQRPEENEVPQQRRRYPDRTQSYTNYDPGAVFRNPAGGKGFGQINNQQQQSPVQQTQAFPYEPFPTNNNSRSNVIVTRRTTTTKTTVKTTQRTTVRPGQSPARSPFDDPNRYRVAQTRQQSDQVRFVNGRPYK